MIIRVIAMVGMRMVALALMVETLAALGLKQLARSRGRRDLPATP